MSLISDFQFAGQGDLLNFIIENATESGASDIHIEPERDNLAIRFRIDGLLQSMGSVEHSISENLISKIKILSKMNITENRLPQDGHFEFKYKNLIFNIRVSSLPTIYGETLVMRIMGNEGSLIHLDGLGFTPEQLQLMYKMITTSFGMILVTGPTGSGKTTLLYSIISQLNTPQKSIVTLEDPIEYQLKGVRQTQINESIELGFSTALRSVVRQDPDIIMLGEVRDATTAEMAIQAALTGILVFSTFHTFDVPAMVTRFGEMGVSNSIIAQAVKGVVSTKLVRKVCTSCAMVAPLTQKEMNYLGLTQPAQIKRGKGCTHCKNTGYNGRVGIFEVAYFDDDVKAAIIEKKPASSVYQMLRQKNIKSLKDSAIDRILDGTTTPEEVFRTLGYLVI